MNIHSESAEESPSVMGEIDHVMDLAEHAARNALTSLPCVKVASVPSPPKTLEGASAMPLQQPLGFLRIPSPGALTVLTAQVPLCPEP